MCIWVECVCRVCTCVHVCRWSVLVCVSLVWLFLETLKSDFMHGALIRHVLLCWELILCQILFVCVTLWLDVSGTTYQTTYQVCPLVHVCDHVLTCQVNSWQYNKHGSTYACHDVIHVAHGLMICVGQRTKSDFFCHCWFLLPFSCTDEKLMTSYMYLM